VRLLRHLEEEQEVARPYYDIHKLCSKLGADIPRTDALAERVTSSGRRFVRTHFSDVGFRTDMPYDELTLAVKELGKGGD
jgi:tRNA (guanine26-N2/guanine27-N2)-dimethyltransferase